jgi:hypothetical protein
VAAIKEKLMWLITAGALRAWLFLLPMSCLISLKPDSIFHLAP